MNIRKPQSFKYTIFKVLPKKKRKNSKRILFQARGAELTNQGNEVSPAAQRTVDAASCPFKRNETCQAFSIDFYERSKLTARNFKRKGLKKGQEQQNIHPLLDFTGLPILALIDGYLKPCPGVGKGIRQGFWMRHSLPPFRPIIKGLPGSIEY